MFFFCFSYLGRKVYGTCDGGANSLSLVSRSPAVRARFLTIATNSHPLRMAFIIYVLSSVQHKHATSREVAVATIWKSSVQYWKHRIISIPIARLTCLV